MWIRIVISANMSKNLSFSIIPCSVCAVQATPIIRYPLANVRLADYILLLLSLLTMR